MKQSVKASVFTQITEFIGLSKGLDFYSSHKGEIRVKQKTDYKELPILLNSVTEVLPRVDHEDIDFLQVNFENGKKLLLTQNLIGFKPIPLIGLDMERLPKVVTTPDLISVVEAIEEAMNSKDFHPIEIEVLKDVFSSVLEGGEAIGFDLTKERAWLNRLTLIRANTPA